MTEETKDNVRSLSDKLMEVVSAKAAIITYGTPIQKMLVTSSEAFMTAVTHSLTVLYDENRREDLQEYRTALVLLVESITDDIDDFLAGKSPGAF